MYRRFPIAAILVAALLLSGCAVKFIADYDFVTDNEVQRLMKEVDGYLASKQMDIQTSGSPGAPDERTYTRWNSEVSVLKSRAEAIPLNELTVDQIDLLFEALDITFQADKSGFGTVEEVQIFRDTFDSIFRAVLKLENAKKRGD